jgi:hypothetical protein
MTLIEAKTLAAGERDEAMSRLIERKRRGGLSRTAYETERKALDRQLRDRVEHLTQTLTQET